ncbi:MAG: bifunctional adenosylcobinamide kinase/adenosylcobinamide-phosphate guanylyltransferase [Treponema sp.]|nr:bifunctional adenosylcobinamide kinase/adenosylcobinamide-phosphate guanylyltransferase [Treponema sp.]
MTVVIGGRFSGRHDVASSLHALSVCDVTKDDALAFFDEISSSLKDETLCVQACLSRVVEKLSSFDVVVATEMGCGVVPMEENARVLRDANGKLNQALALVAEKVVLCVCGVPKVIKDESGNALLSEKITRRRCVIFRHGRTKPNVERRFAGGGTDCAMTDAGRLSVEEMKLRLSSVFDGYEAHIQKEILSARRVFVSPMVRARETAKILFPQSEQVVVDGLCEMRMGLFENMTHEELSQGRFADGSVSAENAALYQRWLDSAGQEPCPSSPEFAGESISSFSARVENAVRGIAAQSGGDTIVIVAHGGVQMALCAQCFSKAKQGGVPYFKWQSDNAQFRFGELFLP